MLICSNLNISTSSNKEYGMQSPFDRDNPRDFQLLEQ